MANPEKECHVAVTTSNASSGETNASSGATTASSAETKGMTEETDGQHICRSASDLENSQCEISALTLTKCLPDVKDKGYAWVVIAVMFISNVVTAGYIKSFGVMYNAVVRDYPGTTAAAGGVMMALLAGCRSVPAPLVGAATVQFGYRPVMMGGVLLCSSGLIASYFCVSVSTLAITLGAMMGTGMCCIETSQVVVLTEYFSEKKELANSIRIAGNPLGGAAFPIMLVLLFEYYGLKMTYIILAGLLLQLSVLIFLIRPYKTHQKIVYIKQNKILKGTKENVTSTGAAQLIPDNGSKPEKLKRFDLKLWTNPIYLCHIAMICGLSVALPQTLYFVPIFGRSINLSPEENSVILAYQSVLDSAGRLFIGFLLNRRLFMKTRLFSACLVIGGIGTAIISFSSGVWSLIVTTTFHTIGSSGYFVIINVILIDQFGRNNVASSWGFIRMTQGILNFAYPPLLGLMVDYTDQFYLTFFTMGGGMVLAGMCIAIQPFVAKMAKINIKFQ